MASRTWALQSHSNKQLTFANNLWSVRRHQALDKIAALAVILTTSGKILKRRSSYNVCRCLTYSNYEKIRLYCFKPITLKWFYCAAIENSYIYSVQFSSFKVHFSSVSSCFRRSPVDSGCDIFACVSIFADFINAIWRRVHLAKLLFATRRQNCL